DNVRQGVLIPTAYYTGETFRPGPRGSLPVHENRWRFRGPLPAEPDARREAALAQGVWGLAGITAYPPRDNRAGLVGEDDGLDAVAQAELGEQVTDVGLDGRLADEEVLGDLQVGAAPG